MEPDLIIQRFSTFWGSSYLGHPLFCVFYEKKGAVPQSFHDLGQPLYYLYFLIS